MKRRGGVSARHSKALRGKAAVKARRGRQSAGKDESAASHLKAELDDALDQLTATAEVLQVISKSPGDLQGVFKIILESATRLCGANFGTLLLAEGDAFRVAARYNAPPALVGSTLRVHPSTPLARAASTKQFVQTLDYAEELSYKERDPIAVAMVERAGVRSLVVVPMLKDNDLIGTISIYRQEVRRFTDQQIALLTSFASHAVVAIENTRLLTELRESLAQQTATSEVLKVISSSPGDLKPVFDAMLENAGRLCEAPFGSLLLRDGGVLRIVASRIPAGASTRLFEPGSELVVSENRSHPLVRILESKEAIHLADARTDPAYIEGNPRVVAFADKAGARTTLCVPMLKNDACIGVFVNCRLEVRPLTDKQIELVKNFAAQAVIAIENARLLTELRQRTDDLTESLERQTATAEILSSISGSISDARPVFDTILRNLLRLFGTRFAAVQLVRDGMLELAGVKGDPDFESKFARHFPIPLDDTLLPARAIRAGRALQQVPIVGNPEAPPRTQEFAREFAYDALLAVPLIRQGTVIGALNTAHRDPIPFTDKQVALIKSFAD